MIRHIALALPLFLATPALSASSQWQQSEGGAVRIVTSGLPDAGGRLKGALEIELKPGWKTYWRNPGAAGIPPQLDVSRSTHVSAVDMQFPPPQRIQDGDVTWAGYKHSVSLPVTFTMDRPDAVALIDADVFLGICETICIPFQASFLFDPGADADNAADALAVERAFAHLPDPAGAGFGITHISRSADALTLTASLPEGAQSPLLFIDHSLSRHLGTPILAEQKNETANFVVEIFDDAGGKLEGSALIYTLTAGEKAVMGESEIP